MIPEPTREAIRADLRAGLSQRVTAAKHGVALGTVTTIAKTLDAPPGPRPSKAPRAPAARAPTRPAPPEPAAPPPATWSPAAARIVEVRADIEAASALQASCTKASQMPAAVAAFKSVTALRRELARLEAELVAGQIRDPLEQMAARVSILIADGNAPAAAALSVQLAKQREKDAAARAEAKKKAEDGITEAEQLAQLEADCLDAPDAHLIIAVRAYCTRHNLPLPTLRVAGGADH